MFPYDIETLMEVQENSLQFFNLTNFHSCFYNCIYGNMENVFYFKLQLCLTQCSCLLAC